jgi:hypothetical protein
MLNSFTISFCLFSFHIQKLGYFFIPSANVDSILFVEIDESAYLEHVILGFETVRDYVSAQWDQFNSFELSTNFPANVINAEL